MCADAGVMGKKSIERLYGLPFVLLVVMLLAKYLDLFPVPVWLLGMLLLWGAVAFFAEALKRRKGA